MPIIVTRVFTANIFFSIRLQQVQCLHFINSQIQVIFNVFISTVLSTNCLNNADVPLNNVQTNKLNTNIHYILTAPPFIYPKRDGS